VLRAGEGNTRFQKSGNSVHFYILKNKNKRLEESKTINTSCFGYIKNFPMVYFLKYTEAVRPICYFTCCEAALKQSVLYKAVFKYR